MHGTREATENSLKEQNELLLSQLQELQQYCGFLKTRVAELEKELSQKKFSSDNLTENYVKFYAELPSRMIFDHSWNWLRPAAAHIGRFFVFPWFIVPDPLKMNII
jgi:flagellar biosynthesis chaperone FliJ